ncbi:MAG: MmgE/PrpD family protein [Alphaproteobacteria bacterium]|nr:MmgE/PrpD family protein [Alphaproteobacteria bacterium]
MAERAKPITRLAPVPSLQGPSATIAESYAAFANRLRFETLPVSTRERAKLLILDAIGIAFASTQYDFAHRTLSGLRALADADEGGAGTVIGIAPGLPWRDAVVANGMLVHGLDFDDTHVEGVVHATASALPCALGLGCRLDLDGRDLLLAYVIAVEIACRLGVAAKGGFHKAGFHPTGLLGAFACAVGAGQLLGLTEAQLAHAQGIALSLAAGTLEFLEDGAWTKRLHPGWAALSGISAATLAKSGFEGARQAYEGRHGLYRTHLGTLFEGCDLGRATADLGTVWQTEAVAVKPLPACHLTHASADAAMTLSRTHDLRAELIQRIELIVPREIVPVVCEPAAQKKRPTSAYEAQFSLPYIVATSLIRRRFTLADIEPTAIADPAVQALAERVVYSIDTNSPYPKYFSGEVVITLKDGRILRHRELMNRGCAERPLSANDIEEKFCANAARAIAPARAERIRSLVLGLDSGVSARELSATLAG